MQTLVALRAAVFCSPRKNRRRALHPNKALVIGTKWTKSEKVISPGAGLISMGGGKELYHLSSNMFSHRNHSEMDFYSEIRQISHPPTQSGYRPYRAGHRCPAASSLVEEARLSHRQLSTDNNYHALNHECAQNMLLINC